MSNFLKEREYYIFGEPMETKLGSVRFLSYKEYLENIGDLSIMSMNSLHIYYQYRKLAEENLKEELEQTLTDLEPLKEEALFNIVKSTDSILDSYLRVYTLLFKDPDVIKQIFSDEQVFMWYRELVMDMNMLTEQEVSKNPEIQKGIESSRELKSQSSDAPTPTDIVTSIVTGTANSFLDVCNMSVIQAYSIFYRIGAFKNFDTTSLFATVSADVKIESWSKNINLYERDSSSIKKSEFDKKYGGLMG